MRLARPWGLAAVAGKAHRFERRRVEIDPELLGDFPTKRGFRGFSCFDLAAREFPEPGEVAARRTALHQNALLRGNKSDGHDGHECRFIWQLALPPQPFVNGRLANRSHQKRTRGMKMSKTSFLTRLFQDEVGATAVEYGLICAMIVLVMLTALSGVADESNKKWGLVSTAMNNAAA